MAKKEQLEKLLGTTVLVRSKECFGIYGKLRKPFDKYRVTIYTDDAEAEVNFAPEQARIKNVAGKIEIHVKG